MRRVIFIRAVAHVVALVLFLADVVRIEHDERAESGD
jgi:hypothetical protein